MPRTPHRTVRIPDWIWIPAQEKAQKLGVPVSQVIRTALWEWTRDEREGKR